MKNEHLPVLNQKSWKDKLRNIVKDIKLILSPEKTSRALTDAIQVEAVTTQMLMTLLTRKQLKDAGKLTDEQDFTLQVSIDKFAQKIRSLGGDPDTVLQRFFEQQGKEPLAENPKNPLKTY